MSIPTIIIYLIWARAEVQPWNECKNNKNLETVANKQEEVTRF